MQSESDLEIYHIRDEATWRVNVSVSLACYGTCTAEGWRKQLKFISHSSGGWGVKVKGPADPVSCLMRKPFLVLVLSSWGRKREREREEGRSEGERGGEQEGEG